MDEPFLRIDGVTRRFGEVTAVNDVSLDIRRGELFCLLGGSGCGKSTLLRMLAGFERPDAGRIMLDGADMTGVPPEARSTNMMFQSYALFPHMSVARNVGYGLRRAGMGRGEVAERVDEMLRLVQLDGYANRKPDQLSGGQRQRVALARALAVRPKLLLLDEPLGALDRKLREETQLELKKIQATLGITFVVVTHDQEEAMTLGDRLGVMRAGRIEQVGPPHEVYENPGSRFVADFIGTVTLFEGRMTGDGTVEGTEAGTIRVARSAAAPGQEVAVALRPEKIAVSRTPDEAWDNRLEGEVQEIVYNGNLSTFHVGLPGGKRVRVSRTNRHRAGEEPLSVGDRVLLGFDSASAVVLTG